MSNVAEVVGPPSVDPDSGWREHGGGIDAAARRYAIPAGQWLDLSTGINPWPYELPPVPARLWQRLPDSGLCGELQRTAAAYYQVDDPGCVVAAPGSQALIQWLPRLQPPTRVSVLGPTYNEHAAAWSAAGHRVAEIGDIEDVAAGCRVLVVVNPNNPDGRLLPTERLIGAAAGRLLVVDEAFADVAPAASLAPRVSAANVVVLRSVGKFFGLAGMRLGFAIAKPAIATALTEALGPWAVSGPAAAIGARALGDHRWIAQTRRRLEDAAAELDAVLGNHGLTVIGGTPLFRLVDDHRAPALFDQLARRAILVRRFAARPSWLRLGLPGDAAALARLDAALAAAIAHS